MRLRSGKNKYISGLCICSWMFVLGCQISPKRTQNPTSGIDSPLPLVDEKYSLTADRKEFEELRKNIPEEKKKENDELAYLGQLFSDLNRHPSQIREKFNSALRKKRELFQKDMTKARETYVKEERQRREVFNKEQEEARRDFKKRKTTREQSSEFYAELDAKRKDFSSSERDKRDEFEAEVRDKRRNFDDYAREKNSEFNQELRAYTKRYDDLQKEKQKQSR